MQAPFSLPVIIVSYNTRDLLRRCLVSLGRCSGVSPHILVVDNGSADGSAEMVRSEFPHVRLLPQPSNLGFARANNVALKLLGFAASPEPALRAPAAERAAGAVDADEPDCVLLLNPDAEPHHDALERLVAFLHSNPRAAVLGPQLYYPDGRRQHSAFHFPGLWQTLFEFFPAHPWLRNSRLNGRYARHNHPFRSDHPLGACMLVRSQAIRQVGLLDEGFFMYVEEVDWCRRFKGAGWEVWCVPSARVVHHEAQAARQSHPAMYVALWRSRLRYFRKYYPPVYVGLIRAVIRLGLWAERRRLRRQWLASPGERDRRLAVLAEVRSLQ